MIYFGGGHVYHSRHEGAENAFHYPTFFLQFRCSLESHLQNQMQKLYRGFFSISASSYLDGTADSFELGIKSFLKRHCAYEAEDVWLHTLPKMFGYVFNPVTFWFCKKAGELDAVLVEVSNTFGEKHFYWIKSEVAISGSEWYLAKKVFHVSPFFPVEGYYKFRFALSDESTRLDINYYGPNDKLRLATWVSGNLSDLQQHSLAKVLTRYGWLTVMIIFRIHFQAFKLFLKKSRFYRKPALPEKKVSQ